MGSGFYKSKIEKIDRTISALLERKKMYENILKEWNLRNSKSTLKRYYEKGDRNDTKQ